jgi:hypothetical protein
MPSTCTPRRNRCRRRHLLNAVAGQATVSADGETHDVAEPEVIDAATPLPMLSPKQRRTFERVGIAEYPGLTTADFHAVFDGALRAST